MSKRSLPATPFRLIGPEGSYETSSSSIRRLGLRGWRVKLGLVQDLGSK